MMMVFVPARNSVRLTLPSYLSAGVETLSLAKILGPELQKYWSQESAPELLSAADESTDRNGGTDMRSKPTRKLSLQDKLAGWTFAGVENEPAN